MINYPNKIKSHSQNETGTCYECLYLASQFRLGETWQTIEKLKRDYKTMQKVKRDFYRFFDD